MPGLSPANLNKPNPDWKIEDQYREPFSVWKASPSPQTNAAMLNAMRNDIRSAARQYGGGDDPITFGRAKSRSLQALRSYDPTKGKLQTHLHNHLQGLQRDSRQRTQVVRIPERAWLDQNKIRGFEQSLADELGRDPTDNEMADFSGVSLASLKRARTVNAGMAESQLEAIDPTLPEGIAMASPGNDLWTQVVYQDLDPTDQKILEWTLGLNGNRKLSNQQIAAKLRRSPGLISQRKKKIQEILDQEPDFATFLG